MPNLYQGGMRQYYMLVWKCLRFPQVLAITWLMVYSSQRPGQEQVLEWVDDLLQLPGLSCLLANDIYGVQAHMHLCTINVERHFESGTLARIAGFRCSTCPRHEQASCTAMSPHMVPGMRILDFHGLTEGTNK